MHFKSLGAAVALFLFAFVAPARAALGEELSEINRLHHAGQTAAALERADRYLAAQPKDAQMRFLKSVLLADSGKRDAAEALLLQLTQEFPELAEPHNNLAALAAARGDYGMARSELEDAVRLNPGYAPARENLGDVYAILAAQAYARALRQEPQSASLPRKIGLIGQVTVQAGPGLAVEPVSAASSAGGRGGNRRKPK